MYKNAVIAAVVPAYKEEKMIATVIETMPAYVDHIVIVDDCSPDATSDVVRSAEDPRVTLIRHDVNQGSEAPSSLHTAQRWNSAQTSTSSWQVMRR